MYVFMFVNYLFVYRYRYYKIKYTINIYIYIYQIFYIIYINNNLAHHIWRNEIFNNHKNTINVISYDTY